jgi:hypothetical protein
MNQAINFIIYFSEGAKLIFVITQIQVPIPLNTTAFHL